MESIAWEVPPARKTFGGTPEEARPHAFYAYNQGFYNLFLAIETIIGAILIGASGPGPQSQGRPTSLPTRPPAAMSRCASTMPSSG